ncbi:hypothetical protein HZB60_00155 [candidate division KSB1 bacterium]|nr:hypothetical protein [candidate division KSB1 bacterium]
MRNTKYFLAACAVLIAVFVFDGCDRLTGDANPNAAPDVRFVNTPMDTSTFNYAPIVYWIGYDSDGLISGYEYYDDSTEAAREAYRQDRTTPGTLKAYIDAIPADDWVRTSRTQETIYLGTAAGETKEHVFIVRAIDDKEARSLPKVRTYFRTNVAPDPPLVKWSQSADEVAFARVIVIAETLFWGDTVSTTYPGIEFLWQGNDADSRDLNIIPLEFSYALVRLPNDTIPHPIYGDSLNIVGYEGGWSPWSEDASVVFFGQETGDYVLTLRVRDDGLTLCHPDSFAYAYFKAIKPTFAYQLLIVDETSIPTNNELNLFGARNADSVMAFYYDLVPQAFHIAELFRSMAYDSLIPTPFEDYEIQPAGSGAQVQEFDNKNVNDGHTIPYGLIGQFKWVWVIHDNNANNTDDIGVDARQHVMDRYLRVGGQIMLSGRRLFSGGYLLAEGGEQPLSAQDNGTFFTTFFNLNTVSAKSQWGTAQPPPEFSGATTSNTFLPDLKVDTAVCASLNWRGRHFPNLTEIDYFSRATSQTSYDLSLTLYDYNSATRDASYDTTNVDCRVHASSPSVAYLQPAPGHNIIFQVDRIFNVTRDVYAQFLWMDHGGPFDSARIVCSTPEQAGAWLTSDSLQVDYVFSPISVNHNKPVACHFQKHEVVQTRDPRNPNAFLFQLAVLYRTSLFTFPFSFLDTTEQEILPQFGPMNPVAYMVANEIINFNLPRNLGDFNFDFSRDRPGPVGPVR